MFDITALGELLIDFAPVSTDSDGYPTMAAHPGGAPANFLSAINMLGGKTAFLGKVGNDAFGKLLVNTVSKAGIDTRGVVVDDKTFTTLAFVTLDETGDREFSFARKPGADTQITFEELDLSVIDQSNAFHFGTLSLTGEPARTCTQKAVTYAKSKGKLITFDPNLREPLWDNLEEAKEQILWGLKQCDVVKISDNEIEFLFGCSPEEGAQKLLNEFGIQLVFATLGPDGCHFANKTCSGTAGKVSGVKVVDTTGAGDIFGGTAVREVLRASAAPAELGKEELTNIVKLACATATLSATRFGGISSVPTREEVLELLAKQ
jgi:fructokinase